MVSLWSVSERVLPCSGFGPLTIDCSQLFCVLGSTQALISRFLFDLFQSVYFHTSLTEPSIVAVAEIVAVTETQDGQKQHVSCGWGVLPIFRIEDDMPDSSSGKAPLTQRSVLLMFCLSHTF